MGGGEEVERHGMEGGMWVMDELNDGEGTGDGGPGILPRTLPMCYVRPAMNENKYTASDTGAT